MFQEIYYWMCFYIRKIKINKEPDWNAYMLLSILRLINISTIYVILTIIFPNLMFKGGVRTSLKNVIIIMFVTLFLNWIDRKLFFEKREKIFVRYNQLIKTERIHGKIKFWAYVVLSIPILSILIYYKNNIV